MSKENQPATPAAQQSQQSEAIFRLLVSSIKDYAIFMLDPQGNVCTWNEGAERFKGYTSEEIIGKHFSEFYTEEAKRINHPQKELEIARKQGRYEEEGWRVRKDGTTFWANVIITAMYEGDQLVGFAKVTKDLTEHKIAEQQREAAAMLLAKTNTELKRALEVKTRFLSSISHEVRTPMSGIIGMTELLTLEDFGAENNSIVRSIFSSCKRLLQLLNNVLDTARMQSGKLSLEFRRFPIRAVLGDVRQMIATDADKKKLTIVGKCDTRIPEFLCGDELRVRQVLLNLSFNAVKFADAGEINISCSLKEQSQDRMIVRFTVTDSGVGISPEHQEKLFQPFEQGANSVTRVYGGTGLGLCICKELVDLMQGEIGVHSQPGHGSEFWFDIPFTAGNCEP